MPFQAKDKIRLLIQKLGGSVCGPEGMAFHELMIVKTLAIVWTLRKNFSNPIILIKFALCYEKSRFLYTGMQA